MESLGFRDLVGRKFMTDPDFLAELVRDPTTVLADYTLSAHQRKTVLQAVGRERARRRRQNAFGLSRPS